MPYLLPCNAPISDNYAGHVKRGSKEPGTDYACAYGTPLHAPASGTVSVVDNNPNGAEGRRLSIDLDDGRRVSFIHCENALGFVGMRVDPGQVVAISGASGYGKNWYYGPHVHVSLWERPGMLYSQTIDFEPFTRKVESNMANPVINVVPKYGMRPEDGTLWVGKSDGRWARYDPPYAENNRGVISVAQYEGKTIPNLSQKDWEAYQRIWKMMHE